MNSSITHKDGEPPPVVENKIERTNKNKDGIIMCAINIINVIFGSGVLVLPVSFSNAGMGSTLILLSFSAAISCFTVNSIAKLADITGESTYEGFIYKVFGSKVGVLVSICLLLNSFLTKLAFAIVSADNMQQIFATYLGSIPFLSRREVLLTVYILCTFLLSLPNSVAYLTKFSIISVIGIITYSVVVFINVATLTPYTHIYHHTFTFIKPGISSSISQIFFALFCQPSIGAIYFSMKNKSIKRFSYSVILAHIVSHSIYTLIGITGFLTFSGFAADNLLNSYCGDNTGALLARIAFIITLILSAPFQSLVFKDVAFTLYAKIFPKTSFKKLFRIIMVYFICITTYILASIFDKLGIVVTLAGSLCVVPIGLIFPSLGYFMILHRIPNGSISIKILCIFAVILGVFILVYGTVMTIINMDQENNAQKYYCDSEIV